MKLSSDTVRTAIKRGEQALDIEAAKDFHKYIAAMVEELYTLDLSTKEVEVDFRWKSIMIIVISPHSKGVLDSTFEGIVRGVIPSFMIEKLAGEMFQLGELELSYLLSKQKDSLKDVFFGTEVGVTIAKVLTKGEVKNETYRNSVVQ
jgi:hypothetical protein